MKIMIMWFWGRLACYCVQRWIFFGRSDRLIVKPIWYKFMGESHGEACDMLRPYIVILFLKKEFQYSKTPVYLSHVSLPTKYLDEKLAPCYRREVDGSTIVQIFTPDPKPPKPSSPNNITLESRSK